MLMTMIVIDLSEKTVSELTVSVIRQVAVLWSQTHVSFSSSQPWPLAVSQPQWRRLPPAVDT